MDTRRWIKAWLAPAGLAALISILYVVWKWHEDVSQAQERHFHSTVRLFAGVDSAIRSEVPELVDSAVHRAVDPVDRKTDSAITLITRIQGNEEAIERMLGQRAGFGHPGQTADFDSGSGAQHAPRAPAAALIRFNNGRTQ